mmetsp:Transcript_11111/g.31439  ORF Transcript_11111/g.31439 Transcript_11111/m.31439 type:complete len:658 (-) Transcript_11111:1406-3379(-)
MGAMDELLSRAQFGNNGAEDPIGVLVAAPEAERMVEKLKMFDIDEVGSSKWLEQRDWIEKLNVQAHHNAQTHSDEFVMEALVSFDKISTLVHELLVIEAWKAKVLPHLKKHLAKKVDSVIYYSVFYHEATVANLLEVSLYHSQAAEAGSEDALLELVDWCHRKAIYLNNQAHEDANPPERSTQEWMEQSPVDQLNDKLREIDFAVGIASLSITRYLTDHAKTLPLGVTNRIVNTCDLLMALVPLLDNPPWVRRRKGVTQKYATNKWETVERTERLKLSKLDGQVWLAINNLVVDPAFREKYEFNDFRKDSLHSLRRYMNELLFDQLPVLKDLQRSVDELTLGGGGAASHKSHLLLEQVPEMREQLLTGRDWQAIANKQKKTIFGEVAREAAKQRMADMLKMFEFMAGMEDTSEPSKEWLDPVDVTALPVKLDARRKTPAGVWVSYSEYVFNINISKGAESVELRDDEGNCVEGKRYRLAAPTSGSACPLPAKGKVSVIHGTNVADALLELPAPSTKDRASEFPSVVWLTVGILATDGLALQIKLKKNPSVSQRDAQDGEWYIYEPVGGAITLLESASREDLTEKAVTPVPVAASPGKGSAVTLGKGTAGEAATPPPSRPAQQPLASGNSKAVEGSAAAEQWTGGGDLAATLDLDELD